MTAHTRFPLSTAARMFRLGRDSHRTLHIYTGDTNSQMGKKERCVLNVLKEKQILMKTENGQCTSFGTG